MLSVETARKLKEAGLKVEVKIGDSFYNLDQQLIETFYSDIVMQALYFLTDDACDRIIWLPRLDQLLAEIEKHCFWALIFDECDRPPYCLQLSSFIDEYFIADSPEQAAAQALLWILEQKGGVS